MAEEYLSTSRCAAGAPERESSHELHELHELIELQQRKKTLAPATWQQVRATQAAAETAHSRRWSFDKACPRRKVDDDGRYAAQSSMPCVEEGCLWDQQRMSCLPLHQPGGSRGCSAAAPGACNMPIMPTPQPAPQNPPRPNRLRSSTAGLRDYAVVAARAGSQEPRECVLSRLSLLIAKPQRPKPLNSP